MGRLSVSSIAGQNTNLGDAKNVLLFLKLVVYIRFEYWLVKIRTGAASCDLNKDSQVDRIAILGIRCTPCFRYENLTTTNGGREEGEGGNVL